MSRILVVDDEPRSVKLLRLRLDEQGHEVFEAGSVAAARAQLDAQLFDLLITDVRLPDGSGIDLVTEARASQKALPIIVITAYGTVQDAVRAMQAGSAEFVLKPFELEAMALLVERTLESARIRAEHSYLLASALEGEAEVNVVGASPQMTKLREMISLVARSPANVLLLGESGTGKELVANAIHQQSVHRTQPLIKVNCPGIPAQLFESELFGHMKGAFTGALEARKGKFELAGKGSIFLDEIAEIPLELQAKLLRVLEDRTFTRVGGTAEIKVEARVIAATNRDLKAMVAKGRFRSDLYYRLNVFPIVLPPLRTRPEDIHATALHLLEHIGAGCGVKSPELTEAALHALEGYAWPGNVRELRNLLERGLVLAGGCDVVDVDHLPWEIQESAASPEGGFTAQVERFKVDLLVSALRRAGWCKKDAAQALGLSQRAMSHYVSKHALDDYRS